MAGKETDMLEGCVDRNAAVVLSLPSAGMLRNYKSRFLSRGDKGIWVECPEEENNLIDSLILTGEPAAVSAKVQYEKLLFATPVLERNAAYRVMTDMTVNAILVAFPRDIQLVKRRQHYRVRVREDDGLTVRVWQVPEHFFITDKPSARQELIGHLRDISIGGIGLTVTGRNKERPRVTPGERVRVELMYGDGQSLVIAARVRDPSSDSTEKEIRCGAKFEHLEKDLAGRQKLAVISRIVGDLQREEIRRSRLAARA